MAPPLARLPRWLKVTAGVDLALVITGVRDVMRTDIARPVDAPTLKRFARSLGLYAAIDSDGFVAMARKPGLARRLLILDADPRDHVVQLGHMLGYPPCCCRAAKRIGENELDAWASRPRKYVGRYRLIDHSAYQHGKAVVSHIPCSVACKPSLKLALDALAAGAPDGRGTWLRLRAWTRKRLTCTRSS
ncbi:MAG: hypothetical protein ACK4X1_13090 [Terricaulis sp.]